MKIKMKRKDFDQFYDDFSDFSLTSPAAKIRRLNAELPPIMEEDHLPDIALSNEECVIQKSDESLPSFVAPPDSMAEDFAMSQNQERAIILFKPVNPLIVQSSNLSPLSVTVDSNLISGFKSKFYNSTRSFGGKNPVEDDDDLGREADNAANKCTAVVPWVPYQGHSSLPLKSLEHVESEAEEVAAMDIEQNCESPMEMRQQQLDAYRGVNEARHQHHCMITQLPPSPSAPISWFH